MPGRNSNVGVWNTSPKVVINQGILVNKGFTRMKSVRDKATGKTGTGISTMRQEGTWALGGGLEKS